MLKYLVVGQPFIKTNLCFLNSSYVCYIFQILHVNFCDLDFFHFVCVGLTAAFTFSSVGSDLQSD